MDPSVKPLFDSLQADLQKLYEELNGQPNQVLNKKLDDNTWSILQVMHHVILSEAASIAYVKKKMSFNPSFEKAGMGTGFRSLGMKLYLNSPFKYKAPEVVGDEYLPETSTFWEVIKKWNETRDELKQLLDEFPPELLDKEVYKHPAAGRITIKQMLQFFDGHFNRHRKQIRRTLKEYHFVV